MMMCLGFFVFSLKGIPFQEMARESAWRHVGNDPIGLRAKLQSLGPGEDTITLSGELRPEITGGSITLAALRIMGDTGKSFVLLDGSGRIYGMFKITNLSESQKEFFSNGQPKAISFSLSLKRTEDDRFDKLADLTSFINLTSLSKAGDLINSGNLGNLATKTGLL